MKSETRKWCMTLALLALAVFDSNVFTANAQGTAFTYQGRLNGRQQSGQRKL